MPPYSNRHPLWRADFTTMGDYPDHVILLSGVMDACCHWSGWCLPVCHRHLIFFTFILSTNLIMLKPKLAQWFCLCKDSANPCPANTSQDFWNYFGTQVPFKIIAIIPPYFRTKFQQPSAFIFRQAVKAKAKINVVFRNFAWNSLPHVTNTLASILHVKITERFGANKFNKIN